MSDGGDTLFMVRTQGFDAMARLLATRLAEAGVPVLAVVDERQVAADTAPFDKLAIDEAALAAIGIDGLPRDWGWLCGDLCYVLAAAHRPDYARYALIESDVFLPQAGVRPFLRALARCKANAVAAQMGPAPAPKRYSKPLAQLGLDPAWGCIFPVSRVDHDVVREMRALRLEQLARSPGARLNDEGVLAGAIQRRGFSHARLENVAPAQVQPACFDTNPPHLFEAVAADPDEVRLFHPVVPFETVLSRIQSGEKAYSRHRLRKVLKAAPRPMKRALKSALEDAEATG